MSDIQTSPPEKLPNDKPASPVEFDNPEPCALLQGQNVLLYRKGYKVAGVALLGRARQNVKLRRIDLEEMARRMPDVRGVPSMYALDFSKREVHLWPQAVVDFVALIEYGDAIEPTNQKTE